MLILVRRGRVRGRVSEAPSLLHGALSRHQPQGALYLDVYIDIDKDIYID